MQEIQALCDRVIIINQGNLIANTSIEDIEQSDKSTYKINLEVDGDLDIEDLKLKIQAIDIVRENNNYFTMEAKSDIRKELFKYCVDNDLAMLTLNMEKQSLEAVFQALTQ